MGAYGTFVENFPELYETFKIWLKEDHSDEITVRAIYMPNKGSGLKRRKYTSGNTALDIMDDDCFYISRKYDSLIKEGAYVKKISDNILMRLTRVLPFDIAGGFRVYTIERVTGTTEDKTTDLPVKEGVFA